jgi:hypothetical protein
MSQEKNKKTAARKPQNQKTAKSDTEKENTQTQLSRSWSGENRNESVYMIGSGKTAET